MRSINDVAVISFTVTGEHAHDSKAGKELLNLLKERIRRIFGYKGYDSNSIYNAFGENAITPQGKYLHKIKRIACKDYGDQRYPKNARERTEGICW